MRYHNDPEFLTVAERLREIATVLAAGILRLHSSAVLPTDSGTRANLKNPPESGADSLEVSESSVLSVQKG
jgi:hypothetical protein